MMPAGAAVALVVLAVVVTLITAGERSAPKVVAAPPPPHAHPQQEEVFDEDFEIPEDIDCPVANGQVLAAVRSLITNPYLASLDAKSATDIKSGDRHFIAVVAETEAGARVPLVTTYKDDAAYLSGMQPVNGTAKGNMRDTEPYTSMPKAADRALECARDF